MKKIILTIMLSCSVIFAQAGIWKIIEEVVSTAFTIECGYLLFKVVKSKGYLDAPTTAYQG
ncbi:hypothetical protein [Candidatus Azobacteroides pseudotrichonymphae]|uniref:hypothetical protein n=1 Tax=Candidatus Azobacteroides pseudotrichonymphae TaxID=511435 RepID=UPI00059FA164|nr:hypothetical protein [Candidatus Azobacteroides pseudotrichonymphae]